MFILTYSVTNVIRKVEPQQEHLKLKIACARSFDCDVTSLPATHYIMITAHLPNAHSIIKVFYCKSLITEHTALQIAHSPLN